MGCRRQLRAPPRGPAAAIGTGAGLVAGIPVSLLRIPAALVAPPLPARMDRHPAPHRTVAAILRAGSTPYSALALRTARTAACMDHSVQHSGGSEQACLRFQAACCRPSESSASAATTTTLPGLPLSPAVSQTALLLPRQPLRLPRARGPQSAPRRCVASPARRSRGRNGVRPPTQLAPARARALFAMSIPLRHMCCATLEKPKLPGLCTHIAATAARREHTQQGRPAPPLPPATSLL